MREVACDLLPLLERLVRGRHADVAPGGSRGRQAGVADSRSDLDLGLFYDELDGDAARLERTRDALCARISEWAARGVVIDDVLFLTDQGPRNAPAT